MPASNPATAASPATAAQSVGTLKFGLAAGNPPDPTSHYFQWAQQNGMYAKRGLTLDIQLINDDQTSLRGLAAGEYDVTLTGCVAAMAAMANGAPLRVISGVSDRLDYQLIANTDISRPKELEGKNLGVSAPGSVSFSVPKLMIEADGGDFSKVNVVQAGGSSARVQALVAKKVDAAVLSSSFVSRTNTYNYLHSIGDATKQLPDFLFACQVTRDNVIQTRKAALQAFVTSIVEAGRWGIQHPDQAAVISEALMGDTPKEETAAAIKTYSDNQYFNVAGAIRREAWDYTLKASMASGDVKQAVAFDTYVDPSFSQAAVAELGPFTR